MSDDLDPELDALLAEQAQFMRAQRQRNATNVAEAAPAATLVRHKKDDANQQPAVKATAAAAGAAAEAAAAQPSSTSQGAAGASLKPLLSGIIGDIVEHDSDSDSDSGSDEGEPPEPGQKRNGGTQAAWALKHAPFPVATRRAVEPPPPLPTTKTDTRGGEDNVNDNDIDGENRRAIARMGDDGVAAAVSELAEILPKAKLDFLRKRGAVRPTSSTSAPKHSPSPPSSPAPAPPAAPVSMTTTTTTTTETTTTNQQLYHPTDESALLRYTLDGKPGPRLSEAVARQAAAADAASPAYVAGSGDVAADEARPLREWVSLCGSAALPQRCAALRALSRTLAHVRDGDADMLRYAATDTRHGGAGVPLAAAASVSRSALANGGTDCLATTAAIAEASRVLALIEAWVACAHRIANPSSCEELPSRHVLCTPLRRERGGWASDWVAAPCTYGFLLDPTVDDASSWQWPLEHWKALGAFAFAQRGGGGGGGGGGEGGEGGGDDSNCDSSDPRVLRILVATIAVAPAKARETLAAQLFGPLLPASTRGAPRLAALGLNAGVPPRHETIQFACDLIVAGATGPSVRFAVALHRHALQTLPDLEQDDDENDAAWRMALHLWAALVAVADRPDVHGNPEAAAALGRMPTLDEYFPRIARRLQPPASTQANDGVVAAAFDAAATFSTATRLVLLTAQCNAALARLALGWIAVPVTGAPTEDVDDTDVAALVYLAEHVRLGAAGGAATAPGATPGISPQALRHATLMHAVPRARSLLAATSAATSVSAAVFRALRRCTAVLLALDASGGIADDGTSGTTVPSDEMDARSLVLDSLAFARECASRWSCRDNTATWSESSPSDEAPAATCVHLMVTASRLLAPLLARELPAMGNALCDALASAVAFVVPPGHDRLAASAASALGDVAAHMSGNTGTSQGASAALRRCVIPLVRLNDGDKDDQSQEDGEQQPQQPHNVVHDDEQEDADWGVSACMLRMILPWRSREGSRAPLGKAWALQSLEQVQGDPTGIAPPESSESCAPVFEVLASLCYRLHITSRSDDGMSRHERLWSLCRAVGHPGGTAASLLASADVVPWDGGMMPWQVDDVEATTTTTDDHEGCMSALLDDAADAAFRDSSGPHPLGRDPSLWEPLVARLTDAAFGRAQSLAWLLSRALLPREGEEDDATQASILRTLAAAEGFVLLPALDVPRSSWKSAESSWAEAFVTSPACMGISSHTMEAKGTELPSASLDLIRREMRLPCGVVAAVMAGALARSLLDSATQRRTARKLLMSAPISLVAVVLHLTSLLRQSEDGQDALADAIDDGFEDNDLRERFNVAMTLFCL